MKLICSGCGHEFEETFVKAGQKVFCGKTMDYAVVLEKEESE